MKIIISYIIIFVICIGCSKQQVYDPTNSKFSKEEMDASKNRAKKLNEMERAQIQDWINTQQVQYFPMTINYWINIPDLASNPRKMNGERVSYQYDIYDFDQVKLYQQPKVMSHVQLGTFDEIKAVDDAIRYLQPYQEATLLIPSVLAFGTYGDNQKISNDMPIIVKLKMK